MAHRPELWIASIGQCNVLGSPTTMWDRGGTGADPSAPDLTPSPGIEPRLIYYSVSYHMIIEHLGTIHADTV